MTKLQRKLTSGDFGESWFNDGSLTGDELIWQFTHVVSCYEAVGIRILGFECNAGGQNARLLQ